MEESVNNSITNETVIPVDATNDSTNKLQSDDTTCDVANESQSVGTTCDVTNESQSDDTTTTANVVDSDDNKNHDVNAKSYADDLTTPTSSFSLMNIVANFTNYDFSEYYSVAKSTYNSMTDMFANYTHNMDTKYTKYFVMLVLLVLLFVENAFFKLVSIIHLSTLIMRTLRYKFDIKNFGTALEGEKLLNDWFTYSMMSCILHVISFTVYLNTGLLGIVGFLLRIFLYYNLMTNKPKFFSMLHKYGNHMYGKTFVKIFDVMDASSAYIKDSLKTISLSNFLNDATSLIDLGSKKHN